MSERHWKRGVSLTAVVLFSEYLMLHCTTCHKSKNRDLVKAVDKMCCLCLFLEFVERSQANFPVVIVCAKLDAESVQILRAHFRHLDRNTDGVLSYDDIPDLPINTRKVETNNDTTIDSA